MNVQERKKPFNDPTNNPKMPTGNTKAMSRTPNYPSAVKKPLKEQITQERTSGF